MKPALFAETTPILFSEKHFRFLKKCIDHNGRVLQKQLVKEMGIDKSTVSDIKHDLISLGWCKDTNISNAKEIEVRLCKKEEILMFLTRWQLVGQSIPVRPHDINARCLFVRKPEGFERAADKITRKYHTEISNMNHNKKYCVQTEYGKIIFHLQGNLIELWAEQFILPVLQKDIALLKDYICNCIEQRLFKLHEIVKEHFGECRIQVRNCHTLRKIAVGILTKENVSKTVMLTRKLKKIGFKKDKSIHNLDEFEIEGKIDKVLDGVVEALNIIFEEVD